MSIVITSKKFKSSDWYNSDGGVDYLNGCIMDKTIAAIEFYIEKTATNKRLQFDSSTKTITIQNNLDFTSFINNYGYIVGETIVITGTSSNTGTFTLTKVEDQVLTVSESVTTETAESCNVYLTSQVKALDFYYNLKFNPSGSKDDFITEMDGKTLQKYTILDGLDATDTTTVHNLSIGSDNYDWVTDTLTGNTSQATIVGMGVTSHKQAFKIIHTFYQTPVWTRDKYSNFLNRVVPDNYSGNNAPQYVYGIDAKYNGKNAGLIPNSIIDKSTTSVASWFNQTNQRTKTDYAVTSISYVNHADASAMNRLDITKSVDVTIVITSASACFTTSTKVILEHLYLPISESIYQNGTYTLRQNSLNDRAVLTAGAAVINGEFYGSAFQVITNAKVVRNTDSQITITYNSQYSDTVKTILKGFNNDDYNYAIAVTTQNINLTSSDGVDRTNLIADFQNADYDQSETGLLFLKNYIHCYKYPNIGVNGTNSISDYEGALYYAQIPFQLESSSVYPTLKDCSVQVVATKSGKTDFVLEEFTFNTSQICKYNNVQQINLSQSKGYKLPSDSIFNNITLISDSTYDDTGKKGYLLSYPLVLRYDNWIQLFIPNNGDCTDIQKDNQSVSNRWADIANGWSLKLRFNANVIGTNSIVTPYQAETSITVKKASTSPDTGQVFTKTTYLLDENNNEVKSLIKNGVTKIVTLFTGDYTNFSGADTVTGIVGIDYTDNNGGIINRRLASTDEPSEDDSPFSAPAANPFATQSWADGNARINLFLDGTDTPTAVSIETLYTDRSGIFTDITSKNDCPPVQPELNQGGGIVHVHLNPINQDLRLWSDSVPHDWSDSDPAKW